MGSMGHDVVMKSRVDPKYKTKYRVSNWAEYDRALAQRGDITLWISEDAIASWKPAPSGRRGAQRKFSDHAIETARRQGWFSRFRFNIRPASSMGRRNTSVTPLHRVSISRALRSRLLRWCAALMRRVCEHLKRSVGVRKHFPIRLLTQPSARRYQAFSNSALCAPMKLRIFI